jgi:DNA invertase Pin-like site-specific DNA recombinase
MAEGKFVAYYRVSTKRQGRSGLGLDAQREAVERYLNGGNWELAAEFTEVVSGRTAERPELELALGACRLYGATLVVARFDRLYRNAGALYRLRDAGVEFVAVDMPDANRLTVGIMAALAEYESELISKRTQAALHIAKQRGTILGNPAHLDKTARQKGNQASASARSTRSRQRVKDLRPILGELRAGGATSLRDLAAGLNRRAIPAPRGGEWSPSQVRRLLI